MTKMATVAVIGKPNAGKSTFLNRVIGHKISIVTHKVQTTRLVITGISTIDNTQLIFLDTPGIFVPKRNLLERQLVKNAWAHANTADFIILLIDAREPIDEFINATIEKIQALQTNLLIVFNKIDLISGKSKSMPSHEGLTNTSSIFNISALRGEGVPALLDYITQHAPLGDWIYDQDEITTLPAKFLASEITREQIFLKLHQELPYNITVQHEKWEQLQDGSIKIRQVITVSRSSHKVILLGTKGLMIKSIGQDARIEISKMLDIQVHLFLFVRVRENWLDTPENFLV